MSNWKQTLAGPDASVDRFIHKAARMEAYISHTCILPVSSSFFFFITVSIIYKSFIQFEVCNLKLPTILLQALILLSLVSLGVGLEALRPCTVYTIVSSFFVTYIVFLQIPLLWIMVATGMWLSFCCCWWSEERPASNFILAIIPQGSWTNTRTPWMKNSLYLAPFRSILQSIQYNISRQGASRQE